MSFWTCVNTSSLHSSVECIVSMCRHFIFICRLLIIRFILCSHMSTLQNNGSTFSSSLDTVFMCRHFLIMCRHFSSWVAHCSHVLTLQVTCADTLISICLLSKGVNTLSTMCLHFILRFKSVFKCRHLEITCWHFSPKTYFFVSLAFWAPITSNISRCFPRGCVWSSISLIQLDSWLFKTFIRFIQYNSKSSSVDTLWISVNTFWVESVCIFFDQNKLWNIILMDCTLSKHISN